MAKSTKNIHNHKSITKLLQIVEYSGIFFPLNLREPSHNSMYVMTIIPQSYLQNIKNIYQARKNVYYTKYLPKSDHTNEFGWRRRSSSLSLRRKGFGPLASAKKSNKACRRYA